MSATDPSLTGMKFSRRVLLLVATALTAALVALTYHYFESATHLAIDTVWNTWFKTGSQRLVLVPVCIVLTMLYFAAQHWLDRKAEQQQSEGLGQAPEATIINYLKILGIGFLSLLAGASLGPEAILVPASLVVGSYIGTKLFPKQQSLINLLGALGFVALFAAFFNSVVAGVLGLFLIGKQTKAKLTVPLAALSILASIITVAVLQLVEGSAYMSVPTTVDAPDLISALAIIALVAAGFAITHSLKIAHRVFAADFDFLTKGPWWNRGLLAGAGLSAFYLFGGPLVEFTGNQSIAPLLLQSSALGLFGLLWVLVIKILAIAWSKALGYRGGLVFPSIFVASAAVAIAQLYVSGLSFIVGLAAVMAGILMAEKKAKILF